MLPLISVQPDDIRSTASAAGFNSSLVPSGGLAGRANATDEDVEQDWNQHQLLGSTTGSWIFI